MRKCALVAMVTLASLMTWPLTASAEDTTAVASATSNDTAKGDGSTATFPFVDGPVPAQVSFSSVANFNGTEPRGWVSAVIGNNTYNGDVTCQTVDGNVAILGGYIDKEQGDDAVNDLLVVSWQVTAVDNGSSGDEMTFSIGSTPPQLFACNPEAFEGAMTQADVDIHDG